VNGNYVRPDPQPLNIYLASFDTPIDRAYHVGVHSTNPETIELEPNVVTKIPTVDNGGIVVNADGTFTVTYTIEPDAVWEDGTPVSGDDFAFTLETLRDPENRIVDYVGADILPDSIEVGPKSFSFTLGTPTPHLEDMFVALIPKHQVEGTDFLTDWNDRLWYSGGPFRFDEFRPDDGVLRLVRNENYWRTDPDTGQRLPYLDAIEYRNFPDTDAANAAFVAREIDVLGLEIPGALGSTGLLGAGATEVIRSSPNLEMLAFQLGQQRFERNPDSLTGELEFRRVVATALDRDAIAEAAWGPSVSALDSYVAVASPSMSRAPWSRYDFDPDRARKMLGDLCDRLARDCEANPPVVVFTSTDNDARKRTAAAIADMLDAVGIETRVELEDADLFFGVSRSLGTIIGDGRLLRGEWDLSEWSYIALPGLSGLIWWHFLFDMDPDWPGFHNPMYWGTPEVTGWEDNPATPGDETVWNRPASSAIDEFTRRFREITIEANSTIDENRLTALILEAEQIVADQVVIIPLFSNPTAFAVWTDEVADYEPISPGLTHYSYEVELAYRLDR
jgi:ABC-type transport system substrate-binding protein